MNEPITFNLRFSGSYDLLKWIVSKYKKELPYDGMVIKFMNDTFYTKDSSYSWNKNGVPTRVWNVLNKDLVMATLLGRIKEEDAKTLEQLKEEFNNKPS